MLRFLTSYEHTVFFWRTHDAPNALQHSGSFHCTASGPIVLQGLYYLLHKERSMRLQHGPPVMTHVPR